MAPTKTDPPPNFPNVSQYNYPAIQYRQQPAQQDARHLGDLAGVACILTILIVAVLFVAATKRLWRAAVIWIWQRGRGRQMQRGRDSSSCFSPQQQQQQQQQQHTSRGGGGGGGDPRVSVKTAREVMRDRWPGRLEISRARDNDGMRDPSAFWMYRTPQTWVPQSGEVRTVVV
ncbi:hypothetical protein PVAG01_02675 [Phlyctema vagabunda]|uniref:Uncharacterized protein n=1 Tax=Phlyctema vagabunda TaxID=108571 RepID=A0ABR4PRB7_9HELO